MRAHGPSIFIMKSPGFSKIVAEQNTCAKMHVSASAGPMMSKLLAPPAAIWIVHSGA
jgi:hypothetical protein